MLKIFPVQNYNTHLRQCGKKVQFSKGFKTDIVDMSKIYNYFRKKFA